MTIPSTSGRRRARIEIIPLIDIIFFLLATFVMVSLSMVKNQGVAVALPTAATGQPQAQARSATVTVTEAGRLYLDRELVTFDTLPQRLETLHRQDPQLRVVFNGDALAYFGDVVKALDETRQAGIEKVAIQTTGAHVAPPATE